MSTSFHVPAEPARPSAAAAIAIALIASVVVFGLFTAAITFAALAIAFPLAAPIAAQVVAANPWSTSITPADLALAARFADLWWAFAALGIASLVAAVVVAIKAIQHLSPASRD